MKLTKLFFRIGMIASLTLGVGAYSLAIAPAVVKAQTIASNGSEGQKKLSLLKANMLTLQTIVETYAVDAQGLYPKDLGILQKAASKPSDNYWKATPNPYTGATGIASNASLKGHLADYNLYKSNKSRQAFRGMALYETIGSSLDKYKIYGCNEKGELIQENGKVFYLSNEE